MASSMEKQDRIIAQFGKTIKAAEKSNLKTAVEVLIEQGMRRREQRQNAAPVSEKPIFTGYYTAKYAMEASAKRRMEAENKKNKLTKK